MIALYLPKAITLFMFFVIIYFTFYHTVINYMIAYITFYFYRHLNL